MTKPTKKDALEQFRLFCLAEQAAPKSKKIDPDEDRDWLSLSLGFFAALGISNKTALDLALVARYTHHYWSV